MQIWALAGVIAMLLLAGVGVRSCIYNDAIDDLRLKSTEALRQKEQEERERADTERERADDAEDKADDLLARGEALALAAEEARRQSEEAIQCSPACYQLDWRD